MRVRGREEWKEGGEVEEDKKFWDTTWVLGEPVGKKKLAQGKNQRKRVRWRGEA